jgi:hypothetical protein
MSSNYRPVCLDKVKHTYELVLCILSEYSWIGIPSTRALAVAITECESYCVSYKVDFFPVI